MRIRGLGDAGVSAQVEPLGGTVYHTMETVTPTTGAPISVAVPQVAVVPSNVPPIGDCPIYSSYLQSFDSTGHRVDSCVTSFGSVYNTPAVAFRRYAGVYGSGDRLFDFLISTAVWGGLAYLVMRNR